MNDISSLMFHSSMIMPVVNVRNQLKQWWRVLNMSTLGYLSVPIIPKKEALLSLSSTISISLA